MTKIKKTALLILDGWGIAEDDSRSAITQAKTSFYDEMIATQPNATLLTHGEHVGLPKGQMGNSEVGHMNIGAGRIVYQDLARINREIESGEFDKNVKWNAFKEKALTGQRRIHLMGLLSDGGVHSHIDHLLFLIENLKHDKEVSVYIHAFLDGRDTDPQGGSKYLKTIENAIHNSNIQLASIVGRYYAMDRDNRWERTKKAYDLVVGGVGETTSDYQSLVLENYAKDITDEFMEPILLGDADEVCVKEGDSVFFFNFRTDRPRQLTRVLTQTDMPEHNMVTLDVDYLTMTKYDESFVNIDQIYTKKVLVNTLGPVLADMGLSQLRIAETEKYPHVTFFFSAGKEEAEKREHRIMVPSPKVATYDLQPEMSANEITDKLLHFIDHDEKVDFVCLNFANTDMVGHTGVFEAGKKAAECVDHCVKRIVENIKDHYNIIIIADHGNSDFMINEDGSPNTAHTTNPVPIIIISDQVQTVKDGILADVAPTILHLMDVDIPEEMTGKVLV